MSCKRSKDFDCGRPAQGRLRLPPLPVLFATLGTLLDLQKAPAQTSITPSQVNEIRQAISNRIEALTILGGDFGFSDGHLRLSGELLPGTSSEGHLDITKFGGAGDVGDPQELGRYPIGWQPHLQGDMGSLSLTDQLHSAFLGEQTSRFTDKSIEFGGGIRLWVNDSLSFAPTFMGVYGHATSEFLPQSGPAAVPLGQLQTLGLIDWHADVWAVRPALNAQYRALIDRTVITLSSDFTYFHTQGFNASDAQIRVNGNSGFVTNKVDVDIPLGIEFRDHELRTGGYLARTDLFGDLEHGLAVQHVNEAHGRITLDFLNQLWKFQWIGAGASYMWGPGINGWTAGLDVAFRF